MRTALLLASALALASVPAAQSAEDALGSDTIPDLFAALLDVTLSEEVSGASFRVHNGSGQPDTRFHTLKLPWSQDFDVGSTLGTLRLEASAGALLGDDRLRIDTLSGVAKADETWTVLGARTGAGWTFDLGRRWFLRPGTAVSLAYIRNDTTYNDVGHAVLEPVIDGVFVNWDGWAAIGSAELTAGRARDPKRLSTGLEGRYALTRSHTFAATSSAQEGDDTSRFLVTRAEVGAPAHATMCGEAVSWDVFGGWAGLFGVNRDALGFDEFFEIGSGLTLRLSRRIPRLRFELGWIAGQDIRGVSLGVGLAR